MDNENYKVYKHTTPSNKVYIGISLQRQKKNHRRFSLGICEIVWEVITWVFSRDSENATPQRSLSHR